CHFYLLGKCRFGATCTFSHTARAAETVCKFYMEQGSCRYGNKCVFLHPPREGAAPASAPAATAAASSLAAAAAAAAAGVASAAAEDEGPNELCGVCFDSVPRSGKRFGLLTGCDHVFCLE
ncbi:unnamed protein product, partial [Phaeothamnion confervicola]